MAGWGGRRRRFSQSVLGPPIVVQQNPLVQGPPSVSLAPQRRGTPKSELRPPPTIINLPPTPFTRVDTFAAVQGAPRSPALGRLCRLGAPVVLNVPPAIEIYGPSTRLAPSSRGIPKSELRPPTVVAPVLARPIETTFARIRPPSRLCRLGAPVVLNVPSPVEIYGPFVHLAPSSRGLPKSELRPPVVIGAAVVALAAPVAVHLARSSRGAPKSELRPPAVIVTATATFGPPLVRLARIKPVAVHSILRAPTVVAPVVVLHEAIIHLAYSLRGKAKPRLAPPAVVAPVLAPPVATTFARITPPAVHSVLRRPTDTIGLEDQGQDRIHLAYSRRGVPKSRLRPPTVVAPVLARAILVHLAYSRRGRPKPRLAPPTVVGPVLARPIDITLARIRPVATRSILRRPTDLVDQQDQGSVAVTLAYSRRGRPLSTLREPTVVAPVLARPILVHLAYSLRGAPKSILREPTVVSPVLAEPTKVALARITPPPTHSILRPPTDTSGLEDEGAIAVTLAYSLRGQPKSELRPPTVVAPVLARPTLVHLTRIRPQPTHPVLRKPIVIDLRPQVYSLTTWLTYSRRGRPKSFLRPESKFAPQPQADYTLLIHLAYSRRGRPLSKLRAPIVVRAATPYLRPIDTTLAYSSRGKAKPRLAPPAVIRFFVAAPVKVTLAPSRFPRPKSRLGPPTVTARAVAVTTLLVSLAPQSRGVPKSQLAPPSIVLIPKADSTLLVHLAYSSRGVARSILRKPAVVGGGIAFYGPAVTLVRIRPARTNSRLRPPTGSIVVCYGTVVGFDFAPEVCGDDDGATVIGSMESAEVCGDDSGATATGASAPGGSVSGGDAQREGC